MRRSRLGVLVAFALVVALALAGCGGTVASGSKATDGESAGFPLTVKDDAGRTVTIEAEPKRIVSLAPANTEIVCSLGLLKRLVGVTTYDDYPVEVTKIAKIGDFTTPNLEAIAKAKPDLILATGGVQADVLSKLEALDAKVLVVDPKDIKGVEAAITMVAQACGVPGKAKAVNARMEETLLAVSDALSGLDPVPCFIEIGYDPLFTAGSGTLLDDVIERAGGENIVTQEGYVSYSVEQLVAEQPRYYLGTSMSLPDPKGLAARPGYSKLSAVSFNRIAVLEDDLVSLPGPRIAEGVEQMAKALHPDRF